MCYDREADPEQIKRYQKLFAQFKIGFPDWSGQPISPETSVKMMFEVIDKLGMKDTGAFVSHKGNQDWL